MVEESHGPATPEEISSLEEFIPTRLTCLTLLQVSVTVSMAEFNLLHTLMPVIMGSKVSAHLKFYIYIYCENHAERRGTVCAMLCNQGLKR